MRNCNNCEFGSFGLDCNTGLETLYCKEGGFDFETYPESVCEHHQFIKGMEDEKHYIFYDEEYLGPGIFIVEMKEDISQILKIYIDKKNGFPNFRLRAFNYEFEDDFFYGAEFIFRRLEDDKLFDVFTLFLRNSEQTIELKERNKRETDYISMNLNKDIFKFIIEKVTDNLKQNYVDINLANFYMNRHYGAVSSLYNGLLYLTKDNEDENIKKLVKSKLN
ncbi:MAG: hypothetical protein E7170_05120 [Firmicutes bacterium]|nr:hypothetical protein [Bacillota bacterium]